MKRARNCKYGGHTKMVEGGPKIDPRLFQPTDEPLVPGVNMPVISNPKIDPNLFKPSDTEPLIPGVNIPVIGSAGSTAASASGPKASSRTPMGWTPFLAMQQGNMLASELGGRAERSRQHQYNYNQLSSLGQTNPMPSGDFQPNPYTLYARYGGNLKHYRRGGMAKYADGGPTAPAAPVAGPGDGVPPPGDDEKAKMDHWLALKAKYTTPYGQIMSDGKLGNPLDKRMQWLDWANKPIYKTDTTPAQLAKKAGELDGIAPADLLASAMEEGMGKRLLKKDNYDDPDKSQAYDVAYNKNTINRSFHVDGFLPYGLDQIGGMADELIQKGYLPKDFKNNMSPYDAANEIDVRNWADKVVPILKQNKYLPEDYKYSDSDYYKLQSAQRQYEVKHDPLPEMMRSAHTAAFKDDLSAMEAKAAMMANSRDQFNEYSKKQGVQLTPNEQRFFTMAAYNGGDGAAQSLLQYYKKNNLLGKDQFRKARPEVWPTVWDHIIPRMAGADLYSGEHMLRRGGSIQRAGIQNYKGTADQNLALLSQMRKGQLKYGKGGGIHIQKSQEGSFTEAAQRAGMSVQQYAHQVMATSKNPSLRKKANFARNSAKWRKG
jgi:hypothetical protein